MFYWLMGWREEEAYEQTIRYREAMLKEIRDNHIKLNHYVPPMVKINRIPVKYRKLRVHTEPPFVMIHAGGFKATNAK